jgi:hypothetical protein
MRSGLPVAVVAALLLQGLAMAAGPTRAKATIEATSVHALTDKAACAAAAKKLNGKTATLDIAVARTGERTELSATGRRLVCLLDERAAVSGAGACELVLSGGGGKATFTCPQEGVSGTRQDAGLELTLTSCQGKTSACELQANLRVTVK